MGSNIDGTWCVTLDEPRQSLQDILTPATTLERSFTMR